MEDYKAQLIAVEARLVKDPNDESLKALRDDLIELIENLEELEEDERKEEKKNLVDDHHQVGKNSHHHHQQHRKKSEDHKADDDKNLVRSGSSNLPVGSSSSLKEGVQTMESGAKRLLSETELLAKKREKNRKKKAKLREKHKEQLDKAEIVKQSWQSFANRPGLKGITKKSIFASPYSLTGKVGVGTNGIADRAGGAASSSSNSTSSSSLVGQISKQRNRR